MTIKKKTYLSTHDNFYVAFSNIKTKYIYTVVKAFFTPKCKSLVAQLCLVTYDLCLMLVAQWSHGL